MNLNIWNVKNFISLAYLGKQRDVAESFNAQEKEDRIPDLPTLCPRA